MSSHVATCSQAQPPHLSQVLSAPHEHVSGRSPAPGELLGPCSLLHGCLSADPQGQLPGGEHISSCKVEIHLEEAAYLLVQMPSSVSMATEPQHLLLCLPTPSLCLLQVYVLSFLKSPALGTHLLLVWFPFMVILKSKRASLWLTNHAPGPLAGTWWISPAVSWVNASPDQAGMAQLGTTARPRANLVTAGSHSPIFPQHLLNLQDAGQCKTTLSNRFPHGVSMASGVGRRNQ